MLAAFSEGVVGDWESGGRRRRSGAGVCSKERLGKLHLRLDWPITGRIAVEPGKQKVGLASALLRCRQICDAISVLETLRC